MVKVTGSDSAAKPTKKTAAKSAAKSAVSKSAAKPATAKSAVRTTTPKPSKPPTTPAAPVKAAEIASSEVVNAIMPTVNPAPDSASTEAEPVMVEPKLVTSTVPVVTGPEMKKKDLLDKVVKRSGIKKKDAKPVVEAMLFVLGEAIAEGRELVLQPLGRLKTTRVKETANGRVLICRLRQGGGDGKADKEALADDDD